MSFGVGGSLFDDPVGFIKPVTAGGGGVSKVGSATFRYTAADGNDSAFTMDVSETRVVLQPDTAFSQSVESTLLKLFADTSFTMDAAADMTMFTDTAFDQSVSRVQIDPSEMLAGKDSYVDVTVGCVGGGTNHDGADLQVEGITATRKDAIFGWDVTGFPANGTVISATVTLEQKTVPTVTGTNTLNVIAPGNEGWAEGSVVCNNIPASIAATGTFSNSTSGTKTITLNSIGTDYLTAALGATSFSLRMSTTALVTNHAFESADEGTNDAAGPRLDFVFTVPT